MPTANDLQEQVEIWKYDYSNNVGGTPIEQFMLYKKTYAGVRFLSGTTSNEALGNLPNSNVEFTIRYDDNIDYKCQINYEHVFYKINFIQSIKREGWMKIQTVVFNQIFD